MTALKVDGVRWRFSEKGGDNGRGKLRTAGAESRCRTNLPIWRTINTSAFAFDVAYR